MGRVLGIDYGTKRVGLALSDTTQKLATPLMVCERQDAVESIGSIMAENDVESIVVGMPTSLSGEEGIAAQNAKKFVDELKQQLAVPVMVEDERFTTVIAERAMIGAGERRKNRRNKIDSVAAAIILQGYLDRQMSQQP
jgi:putative Holliday junction resolvase